MKVLFCFAVLLAVTGCGSCERMFTGMTGGLTYKCSSRGAEYVQSDSGLAVSYDGSGQIVKCSN